MQDRPGLASELGARLVPAVGTLTWGLNALGHASFLRYECLGARLVPTVGMTWGTPHSYRRKGMSGRAYAFASGQDS